MRRPFSLGADAAPPAQAAKPPQYIGRKNVDCARTIPPFYTNVTSAVTNLVKHMLAVSWPAVNASKPGKPV
jgi:hypothetical protein